MGPGGRLRQRAAIGTAGQGRASAVTSRGLCAGVALTPVTEPDMPDLTDARSSAYMVLADTLQNTVALSPSAAT